MSQSFWKYVLAASAVLFQLSQAAFYDCITNLASLRSDADALELVKKAHAEKLKFSSQCLEIVLKKNFFKTGEYMIDEYYPKTSIDTEVIVRNVANDIKRNQDYLIFQVKKRELNNNFISVKPVIYWAQHTEDLLLMVRLHSQMDTPDCKQSFEREVIIEEDRIRVQAYCYESEDNIRIFDTDEVIFKKKIIPEKSTYEWRGDGKLILNLRKANAPSFWKYLLQDVKKEVKELQVWWEMRDRYIEQLEEYMMEENAKERLEQKASDL
ncbi:UNKNOWN [Stylonychia lemnae]|uniref:CS domain-containing protein n=1 Tax=Stylonychia lemnae TaxID=5949 RepID=A0A078B247_STYLE|nr:UNKNOWN [Stylonychia lemnae]|eukprot:CDW87342.1 UNKNOWN [Stylonychia lemnae]